MNAPTGGAAGTYPELFANVEQIEADWFRRTGIYPIHGLIVVKDEHITRHPWLARSLMNAFVAAKRPYLDELKLGRRRRSGRQALSGFLLADERSVALWHGRERYPASRRSSPMPCSRV